MKPILLWSGAVLAAAVLLVAADYHSRDPDSALYARLSSELAKRPASEWIAPEWGGAWNQEGLFREHPVGILIPTVLAIRAGFPSAQAAYAVNMLYQVAIIVLIPLVAAAVARPIEARALAWVLQLLPVSFAYRIRGNQEHPVLMCFLAMLYGAERARTRPLWLILIVAPFCFMVLIKGAFAMFGLVAVALWLLIVPPAPEGSNRWPWAGVLLSIVSAGVMMAAYEAVYRSTTGDSFVAFYRSTRLGESISLTDPRVVPHAAVNVFWYLLRLAWFAAPWSLCAFAAAWTVSRSRTRSSRTADAVAVRAMFWAFLLTAVYIAVLSPALVRAERFIFPTYYIIGAVGFVAAVRSFDRLRRLVARTDAIAWLSVAVWFVTFLLNLASRLGRGT
jgi:hypothetical protein